MSTSQNSHQWSSFVDSCVKCCDHFFVLLIPYRFYRVQILKTSGEQQRLGIANKFLGSHDQNDSWILLMLWVDEAQFSLTDNVNVKNYVYCWDKNILVMWYEYIYTRPKWLHIVASPKRLRSRPARVWRDDFEMSILMCSTSCLGMSLSTSFMNYSNAMLYLMSHVCKMDTSTCKEMYLLQQYFGDRVISCLCGYLRWLI